MIVYIDSVFLLNSLVDGVLLYFTGYLAGLRRRPLRLFAASLLGGFYAVVSLLPFGGFFSVPPIQIVVGILLIWAVYGRFAGFLRTCLLFFGLSCLLAGGVTVCGIYAEMQFYRRGAYLLPIRMDVLFLGMIVCFLLLYFFCRGSLRHRVEGTLVTASFRTNQGQISLRVLRDSGNTLQEPWSGAPVLVAEAKRLAVLWPEHRQIFADEEGLLRPEQLLAKIDPDTAAAVSLRLLPYRSVGTAAGLLLACTVADACVGSCHMEHLTIALSPTPVSEQGEYDALWGGPLE